MSEFNGQVTIKVKFRNNPEYKKFRDYILRTPWKPGDVYPQWEELVKEFHSVEDLDQITRVIVMLLQMGFEVYSTNYKLEEQLAEEEHPMEEDTAYKSSDFEEAYILFKNRMAGKKGGVVSGYTSNGCSCP